MIRLEAAEQGSTTYEGKKVCPKGHGTQKYVANGTCVVCARERRRADRAKAPRREKPPAAQHRFTDKEFVYEAYSADDELLYVGRTNNPYARVMNHRNKTPWWDEVVRLKWSQHPNPEFSRIVSMKPKYNVLGTTP